MTADWWAATLAGDRVLMLATRWSDVDDLNARARAHLQEAGKLTGPALTVDERPYQAGDRIMTLRNDRRLGVRNGTCAAITAVDHRATRDDSSGPTPEPSSSLPARYLDAGHVRHAYATTIHKAQGQTVDRAFVLGSDTLYQEAGYVALSRGRAENRIYLVGHRTSARSPRPRSHTTRTHRSPHPSTRPQPRPRTRRRQRNRPRRHPARTLRPQCTSEGASKPSTRLPASASRRNRITHHQCDNRTSRTSPDSNATSQPSTRNAAGDNATNDEDAASSSPPTSDYHTGAIDSLDQAIEHAHEAQHERDEYLKKHHDECKSSHTSSTRSTAGSANSSHADIADPPAYLRELGAPPKDPASLARWRAAADYVEHYRVDHYITDPHRPLGNAATFDTRRLQELTAQVREPTREIDHGVGIM